MIIRSKGKSRGKPWKGRVVIEQCEWQSCMRGTICGEGYYARRTWCCMCL